MDDFDRVCPRCQGKGAPASVAKSATAKSATNPPLDVRQDVINGLMGALIFLLPALFVIVFFFHHIENNQPPRPQVATHISSFDQPYVPPPAPFNGGSLPMITACGAALGVWIGSGLVRVNWKRDALIGGVVSLFLGLISPAVVGDSGAVQALWLYFLLFLVMLCGVMGSIARARNYPQRDNSLLVWQCGVAVLCFVAPPIGFFAALALGKNGSDYATPALFGSIAGFIVIGLPLLMIVFGH